MCLCVCVCVYPVPERTVVDCLERAEIVGCAVGQVVCGGVSWHTPFLVPDIPCLVWHL